MGDRGAGGVVALALFIAACTPAVTIAPSTGMGSAEPGSSASADASQGCGTHVGCVATVRVAITGGSKAGLYEATVGTGFTFFDPTVVPTAPPYGFDIGGACARNPLGPNTFELRTEGIGPAGFAGPVVSIFDAAAAASGTDHKFKVVIRFGFENPVYAENPVYEVVLTMSPGQDTPLGSGFLTLDDHGATATIQAKGTLNDGSTATVDVDCRSVTNL